MIFRVHQPFRLLLSLTILVLLGPNIAATDPATTGNLAQPATGPVVALSKSVSPSAAAPHDTVTYTITIANAGDVAAEDLTVVDTLPNGFGYQVGSTTVHADGVLIGGDDPTVDGGRLSWSNLQVAPLQRRDFYGIHTFVQERCQKWYIDWQLDRARELMGPGAWVKQLFHGINTATTAPSGCWVDFVNGAYDRDLKPVLRLQGQHGGSYWHKPYSDGPGHYGSIAEAFRKVVAGLPRRDGHRLYIEIWNEPNLSLEWSNAASPVEYGQFLEQTASAIRSIGDSRISILNGGLSPGGDIDPLAFIDQMVGSVPGSLWAWDLWSTHPYPGNHPPEYNIHDGSATHPQLTIDSYRRELQRLADWGRSDVDVVLTETGYDLWNDSCSWEGYPTINEANRADYIMRAFRDYWANWPEVAGVCPYQLSDPLGTWAQWDWLHPSGAPHEQYSAVTALDKSGSDTPGRLVITFRATTSGSQGTYTNDVAASASNATVTPLLSVAPVVVSLPTPTPTPAALVVATIEGGQRPHGVAVDTLRNLIYVANHEGGDVSVIDGSLSQVTMTLPLGTSRGSNGIAIDPPRGRLYVANKSSDDLVAVPAAGGPTVSVPVGQQPDGVDVDPGSGIVYVANFGSNTLSLVNGPTNTLLVTSTADGEPSMVVHHPLSHKVYVTNHGAHTVGVYSGDSGELLKSIPVGGGPYGIALDPVRDRLYTANREGPSVTVLDTNSDTVIGHIPMECVPYIVAANPSTGRFFPVCAETQQLHVFDGETLTWLSWLPVGRGAGEGVAVNPVSNRIYVANSNDDTITVVQDLGPVGSPTPVPTATTTPTTTPTPPGFHEIYLPLVTYSVSPVTHTIPPGRALGETAAGTGPVQSLSVHPRTGWLYAISEEPLTGGGMLTVTDPASGLVLARAMTGGQPRGMALDPVAGQLYVASWEPGRVTVIDAHSGEQQAEAGGLHRPSGLALVDTGGDSGTPRDLVVAETARDRLVIIDASSAERKGEIRVGPSPYTLAASGDGPLVYVALAGGDQVAVVNVSRYQVMARAHLGGLGLPLDIAVDHHADRVYVLYLLTPRYRNIAILDGRSGERLGVIGANLEQPLDTARSLAVDGARQRLYVSDASGVQVYSTTTTEWLATLPASGPASPFALAVDIVRGQLYGGLPGEPRPVRIFP
jgi:uncharacterized repeat protein (TIGR01451 family)